MKTDFSSKTNECGSKRLTLANAPRSVMLKIKCIEDDKNVSRQLTPLGIFPGASIELISCNHGGPVVLDVCGSHLMLDSSIAEKIIVSGY
jgi:Fe2+ transport system protein FeoA